MQSLNIKESKLLELQITQTRHPLHISNGKMSKFNFRKNVTYLSNVHKTGGAHLQCVNNHYAKFDNNRMKTI